MKHNQTASWGFTLNPFSEMLEVNATGGAQASLEPLEAPAGLRYGNEAVPAASWFFKPTQIKISDWSREYESTPHSHRPASLSPTGACEALPSVAACTLPTSLPSATATQKGSRRASPFQSL